MRFEKNPMWWGRDTLAIDTISIPSMENTRKLGLPNACRSCHVADEPGFEFAPFEKW